MFGGRGRTNDLEPIGVIDIGSNSVRLVVYEGAIRSAAPLFNEKVLCGLGRTLATNGCLGKEPTARAIRALTRFKSIARALRVKNLRILATAAARDAVDGPDFISRAEEVCGTHVTVLSGEEEAELAAQGIRMGFVHPDGLAGDLGGGSLELIDIHENALSNASTLPLGGLRLMDQTGGNLDDVRELVDHSLSATPWIEVGRGRNFYAVGGTWRAIAKLHMEKVGYPLRIMHGYAVPKREIMEFCAALRTSKKIATMPGIANVSRARRDVLPFGALILERTLAKIEPAQVIFSVTGIREGLVYSLLPPHEQARDPLLSFCHELSTQRSRSAEHAVELCAWTDALFANGGPDESPEEKRLRHAACLISDIGWRAHPDYRGEQTLNLIAHSGLTGIDHAGRMFLALTLYNRHNGDDNSGADELPARIKNTVGKRAQKRAKIVGAALRTAHMLSIGTTGIIDECPLTYDEDKLVLTIASAYKDLDGERLNRRFSALAGLLDKSAEVRVSS